MVIKWRSILGGANDSNRIKEIDIAKGIGILLVILGHMEDLTSDIWKQFAASFHMPLFFLLCGFLFLENEPTLLNWKRFIQKKAKHILIPYLLWALIYSNGIGVKQLICIFYANNKVYAEAGLWFLPTLFVAECLYYFIKLVTQHSKRLLEPCIVIVFAVLSFLMNQMAEGTAIERLGYPFSFDIALTAVVFIALGYWVKPVFFYILNFANNNRNKMYLTLLGILCLLSVYIMSRINYNFITDHTFDRVVMARASYGLYPLFLVAAAVGSIGISLLCPMLKNIKILQYIGKNSLLYMCLNHFVIVIVMNIVEYMPFRIKSLPAFLEFIIVVIVLFCITVGCSLMSVILNRYLPVLNGKQKL
ncbi:acyltransferase family protein [Robinsoniella peoriensis]|uniref:acyltransferase family protein n=1 Tax=Robinsoniella peoriensis TaxID=180332 RepID=UPI0005C7D649|nr:acyltransferase family protein [Robinsoniella peoriensis]